MNLKKWNARLFLAVFQVYSCSSLAAQESPMKWGSIPEADLRMTVYAPDTAASALVLGNYGDLELTISADGILYNFFKHRRVKILKRSGFDKGDVLIPYFNQGEKINNLQVQVFTPERIPAGYPRLAPPQFFYSVYN